MGGRAEEEVDRCSLLAANVSSLPRHCVQFWHPNVSTYPDECVQFLRPNVFTFRDDDVFTLAASTRRFPGRFWPGDQAGTSARIEVGGGL